VGHKELNTSRFKKPWEDRSMRRTVSVRHRDVVLANLELLRTLPAFEGDVDFDYPGVLDIDLFMTTCWGCGLQSSDGRRMMRAHVIPASRGGGEDPANFFLLCNTCHDEQPDGNPRDAQIEWLREREDWLPRSARVAAEIAREVMAVAGPNPEEAFRAYLLENRVGEVMREGYRSAAGGRLNGRANATARLKDDFRAWLKLR
jgi:5-methylcytosine-specific restriction endonuclease McrA